MIFKHSLITALNGLKANKPRSALTILGIVIGVTAIILIMAIGAGAQNLILQQIRGLGSQTLIIQPGREPKGLSDFAAFLSDSLKEKDLLALQKKNNAPHLAEIMPEVVVYATISYQGEAKQATIIGASELLSRIADVYPDEGVFFSQDDIDSRASVVVIGSEIKKTLFGLSEALGQKVRIKGKDFRVVGVFGAKGQVSMFSLDEMAILPYTTAQEYLLGANYFNEIVARSTSEADVPLAVEEIRATLREAHNITDPDKDDFHIHTQTDIVQRVGVVTGVLTALLLSVAAISLVVGGIGIMNIMLVSVTERTREIGLRKALGATKKDILLQFLLEAVLLTALGGLAGVVVGATLSFLASLVLSRFVSSGWEFNFPFLAAVTGLLVSSLVGLIFGLYPARRAAEKTPIDALRYE
jgi:putative ABC transport system permease protein